MIGIRLSQNNVDVPVNISRKVNNFGNSCAEPWVTVIDFIALSIAVNLRYEKSSN